MHQIASKLNLSIKQVNNIYELHQDGATIPFMARYRKEATGNLDEVVIGNVVEEIGYFQDLEKRKVTILNTISEAGKLTDDLKQRIDNCFNMTELEDIYLPFKPKRKTRATQAIEKGLEPLAKILFEQESVNLQELVKGFVKGDVQSEKDALQGARDIIAEWVSENETARNRVRHLYEETAVLTSKAVEDKKGEEDAQKYKDYFEFSEPLSRCPSHRILAIRRGEKEGYLMMEIGIEKQKAFDELSDLFVKGHNEAAAEVKKAVEDSFNRLLRFSIENEFRLSSKNIADEEAIKVFSENLRQLLLASPLGSKRILAIDPGYRTGCKVVCLDAQGNFLYHTAIYPHPPQNDWQGSVEVVKKLVQKYEIEAIGIGNGTAGRESEQFIRSIDFGRPVSVFTVNESGASIYSASEVAREEFPDQDVTVRGAVSIGRRLLDPLSELVKIDPKSIGVGQYQHDVNQLKLKQALDRVVESAVNFVGVNVNTASKHLLQYVSGISATLAKNIVEYRAANGAFTSRDQLKKVPLMGPKSYEQCAGFLRIPGSDNPLDNSSVHPESYFIVEKMAKDLQATLEDLIKNGSLRSKVNKKSYISETVGEYTIEDILKELEKPGRDPRSVIEEFQFDENIKTINDVKPGMTVPGIVTNITQFGAFVDIGVKQDGLVHVSQLSNRYVSDPNEVVKLQQKVMVTVTEVDAARKRIALSMKEQGEKKVEGRAGTEKNRGNQPRKTPSRQEPLNPFQSKLMELKKKFND